jgi:hypothetical protein
MMKVNLEARRRRGELRGRIMSHNGDQRICNKYDAEIGNTVKLKCYKYEQCQEKGDPPFFMQ